MENPGTYEMDIKTVLKKQCVCVQWINLALDTKQWLALNKHSKEL